ncbi:Blastula protease 10 [Halotydeus destructor]|nr:Blastula protease 10 [Halotydeus destructor]
MIRRLVLVCLLLVVVGSRGASVFAPYRGEDSANGGGAEQTVDATLVCSQVALLDDVSGGGGGDVSSGDDPQTDLDSGLLASLVPGEGTEPRTPDGDLIVEGDMVVPRELLALGGRKAVAEPVLLWPGGVVPFTYHYSVGEADRAVMEAAMAHWEQHTCLAFRPREALDYMWIRFRTDSPGCWSLVGRQFLRFGVGQDVSIGQGCGQLHVVAHELGHAVGFFHEQSRSDRDGAVTVLWHNVQPGYEQQFKQEQDQDLGVPYDYLSVMQYPAWAFSRDVLVRNTIVTLDPRHQRLLGRNTDGLSFRDRKQANALYACARSCPDAQSQPCLNEGYLRPYRDDGRPCGCACPPTATGARCETRLSNGDYYEAQQPLLCGGNLTSATPSTIETPNYPRRTRGRESCVWSIRAPGSPGSGSEVQLVFEGFGFAARNQRPGSKTDGKCFHEAVEVRGLDPAYYPPGSGGPCGGPRARGTRLLRRRHRAGDAHALQGRPPHPDRARRRQDGGHRAPGARLLRVAR